MDPIELNYLIKISQLTKQRDHIRRTYNLPYDINKDDPVWIDIYDESKSEENSCGDDVDWSFTGQYVSRAPVGPDHQADLKKLIFGLYVT